MCFGCGKLVNTLGKCFEKTNHLENPQYPLLLHKKTNQSDTEEIVSFPNTRNTTTQKQVS